MKVRALDDDHDWIFGQSKANYLTNSDAIAQCVKTKLLSLKGDWFLNANEGIAWFNYLERNPDIIRMSRDIKSAVLSVRGVTEITAFDILLDSESRQFLIEVAYNDQYNSDNRVSVNVENN